MLRLKIIDNNFGKKDWLYEIRKSVDWDPFADLGYLDIISNNVKLIEFNKGEKIIGRIALVENNLGLVQVPEFTPYSTLILSADMNNSSISKREKFRFLCFEKLAEFLCELKNFKSLAFNPSHIDLRPFLWFNYHEKNGFKFNVFPRYTARIYFENHSKELLYKNLSKGRKSDLKRSIGLEIATKNNFDEIFDIYKMTFSRQNISIDNTYFKKMKIILQNSFYPYKSTIFTAKDKFNKTNAFVYFLHSNKSAYYLFGGSTEEGRECGALTFLIFTFLEECFNKKFDYLDFVGANSPNRGDFKLSFGSKLVPYYEITKK